MTRSVKLLVLMAVVVCLAPVLAIGGIFGLGFLAVLKSDKAEAYVCRDGSAIAAGSLGASDSLPDIGTVSGAGLERYFRAVFAVSGSNNRLIVSHLMGSRLESRWNPRAVAGGAFGIYQIQHPGVVHPDITVAQALDPVYATRYMAPAYRDGLNNVNPLLWSTDPARAGEITAYNAERPAVLYDQSQGLQAVRSAFDAAIQVMQRHGISTDFGSSVGQSTPTNPANAAANADTSSGICGVATVYGSSVASSGAAKGVLSEAEKYLGLPYVYGGSTPLGFDCSGLVQWSFAKIGISLPRTAGEQWSATRQFSVPLALAKPGDLLFFVTDGSAADPGHVGIYVGNGVMINAPHTGANVRYETITDSYWKAEFLGATDPFAWNRAHTKGGT